ncbi:DNA methyltransferase, partial [Centipeda periodontii]
TLAFYSNKMQEIDGKKTVTELLSDFWSHISWAGIACEGGVKLKNGKKPERLIKQIFDISTDPGDIVLDYHLGSGTTCAVAHKMGLQYIGCEQLDYGENDVLVRLNNVISGDQTGISKAVSWQGGGSFVYCELAKLNQTIVEEIEVATDDATLCEIRDKLMKSGFISYKVNPADINAAAADYAALSMEDKKRFLMDLLDKNLLYVNYCDIDDAEFGVSEQDKTFTRSFYKEV